jgi:hypothetical protein
MFGQSMREQARPVKPGLQVQAPDERTHSPWFEHSCMLCPVFAADALSAHALPFGQLISEQSAAKAYCASHVQALPAPHDPWPLHWFGHCAAQRPVSTAHSAAVIQRLTPMANPATLLRALLPLLECFVSVFLETDLELKEQD